MQLTFLLTSPRVAPGLMTWAAWQAVASADLLLASALDAPLPRAVAAAGHRVEPRPAATPRDLLDAAASRHVVWLASDEEAETFPRELARAVVEGEPAPEVEVLHASYDVPGARLLDLVTVMDELRRHCPWDREQTHRSLARYLLEETYETLEAIETGDHAHLREELGDLLLQVVFHARIAAERRADGQGADGFDVDDVAGDIVDKLVRRHPHVFDRSPGQDAPTLDELDDAWERLKADEKQRASVLDGIPLGLPALALADKVLGRAGRVGVDPGPAGGGLGAQLLELVARARAEEADAEQELREAVRRLAARVRDAEPGGGPGQAV